MPKTEIDQIVKIESSSLRFGLSALMICALMLLSSTSAFPQRRAQVLQNPTYFTAVPRNLLLRIVRAEDERRWDHDVRDLLSARSAVVRSRAALAAGRIGSEDSVADLIVLLRRDDELEVRAMAAFALGEVESPLAVDALIATLKENLNDLPLRARTVEALGKIAAGLPKEQDARANEVTGAILAALSLEGIRRSASNDLNILLGLTAALRAKAAYAGPAIAEFSNHSNPRIRADAANTLARLKLKDGNDYLRKLVRGDPDPNVRANSARVLGSTEDKASFDLLVDGALKDKDARVRVSAIKALTSLKDDRAARPLLGRGEQLLAAVQKGGPFQPGVNEILEIATSIGQLLPNSNNVGAVRWLRQVRSKLDLSAPEVELAFGRVSPQLYRIAASKSIRPPTTNEPEQEDMPVPVDTSWRAWASVGQGLAELALVKSGNPVLDASIKEESARILSDSLACLPRSVTERKLAPKAGGVITLRCAPIPRQAVPEFLRAFAAFKPKDLDEVLRKHLKESDVIIRATAAELLGELPLNSTNIEALGDALKVALRDKESNDAALAIIDALGKQKNRNANLAIMPALDSTDHLIRRKAVASLKATGSGDFSSRIGAVETRNTTADYERAISRIGKTVRAVVLTTKGRFTIELLPEDAPLTVDNFVELAKRGYFNGITFHRVVPNFVIQGGDPRGDGNGGPGYSIRCEINEVPFERGVVGMALSGKDTGGSQWFVTHAPQPHLDGGYTVFGKVIAGMEVVDIIVRGDVIRSITVKETARTIGRPAVGRAGRFSAIGQFSE